MEVRSLFGNDVDLWDAAASLCNWGAPLVVIKNGDKGVLVMEGGNGRQTHLLPYHLPHDQRIIDVTGAGDSFCGGFMVGLARTGSPIQAAQMGLVSASIVIEGYGALYALKRGREEVQKRLKEIERQ
jgi:sugar/nucleoside kinase (ribokinase family)